MTLIFKKNFYHISKTTKMETTTDFINSLGSADLASFIKVLEAYNDQYEIRKYDIECCGINNSSGYVYLMIENCITIASCFGRDVEYIVNNFNNGKECFFDTYDEAFNYLNSEEEEVN